MPSASESPLDAAAGTTTTHVTDAFKLLSDETRLAILLALWDEHDPLRTDDSVNFSELYDRVGASDSGNFTYHLNKLVGHFVEEAADGYRLRNAGLKIVQATIAGAGLEERTLPSTETEMSCHRCGARVEISYENEYLYHICTECEGNTGRNFPKERPVGTLMMFDFDPSGLADRTPGEVFVAGTIKSLREFGSLLRGICPECSGPVEESVHICEDHEAPPGEACRSCGTRDEVRVRYVCSVCKHGDSYPVHAAIYDHPAVVAFCYEHGIEDTYSLDDPEACGELWSHLLNREYTLVSKTPVRIRIGVPGDGETLHLTLDENLTVIETTQEDRETDERPFGDMRTSVLDGGDGDGDGLGSGESVDGDVLPERENCFRYLRRHRWPDGVKCPHCTSTDVIKKGTTNKGAQRYRCRDCDSIFNDLTGTIFSAHRLSLPEMFHIILEMDGTETSQIARQLDRSYNSVLDFVHEVRDARERNAGLVSAASAQATDST